MTTLPEEAVTSAAIIQVITDLRLAILQDDDEGLAEHAEPMVKAKELIAKLSALPFLPVQGAVRAKELPWKDTGDSDQGRNSYAQTRIGRYEAFEMRLLKETIYGWSRGHGDEKADSFEAAKAAAQADFEARILSALEPSAARELALEALRSAEQFIENGFEFGFIRKPDEGDTALETLPKIKAAIRDLQSNAADARPLALEEGFRKGLEAACDVIDAHNEYDRRMCCDGRECGCYGATVHQSMQHYIRSLSSPDHADAGKVEGDGSAAANCQPVG